ncbi:MAG: hypothetical protein IJQ24_06640 [Synergistaceae bacterium]|nr:hypothetical protein [Synergistaceae bacterium]
MSPSVLFVIYLPIHETICNELGINKDDKLANMLMLANLFCCAFACGMTPIAHVFPIMGLGFFESASKGIYTDNSGHKIKMVAINRPDRTKGTNTEKVDKIMEAFHSL